MSMFISRLDGNVVNTSLLQTVYIDPDNATNVIYLFKNGEKYVEELNTEEEATTRYNTLVSDLTSGGRRYCKFTI